MEITSKEEYENVIGSNEVTNGEGAILIDFFTTWCGPCKNQAKIIERISKSLKEIFPKLEIYKFDCELNADMGKVADGLNVSSIPQLILYNGSVQMMEPGVQDAFEILKFLNLNITKNKNKTKLDAFATSLLKKPK